MTTKRTLRTWLAALLALATFFVAIAEAFAAGSITYTRRELTESGGGWKIAMTILYGGKPTTAHVPMKFSFTPTALYERYLDDAHGDKPQTRKIPLSGQQPIIESIDVDFGDPSGKIYDRTRFDFTITRSHNFQAGEYSLTVHRADGAQLGTTQTITLNGENTVIDRRSISFIGNTKDKPKDKPKDDAAKPASTDGSGAGDKAAPAGDSAASGEAAPAPASDATGDKAASGDDATGLGDPTANKTPPGGSQGCGCHTAGAPASSGASVALLAAAAAIAARRRRR
jgi:MYXO-CTERM domain-containing protein